MCADAYIHPHILTVSTYGDFRAAPSDRISFEHHYSLQILLTANKVKKSLLAVGTNPKIIAL
jgi:hypothetical protein